MFEGIGVIVVVVLAILGLCVVISSLGRMLDVL